MNTPTPVARDRATAAGEVSAAPIEYENEYENDDDHDYDCLHERRFAEQEFVGRGVLYPLPNRLAGVVVVTFETCAANRLGRGWGRGGAGVDGALH